MNWTVIIIVGAVAIGIIVLLIIRNLKDKKQLTEKLTKDYRKPRDNEGDTEIEDNMR